MSYLSHDPYLVTSPPAKQSSSPSNLSVITEIHCDRDIANQYLKIYSPLVMWINVWVSIFFHHYKNVISLLYSKSALDSTNPSFSLLLFGESVFWVSDPFSSLWRLTWSLQITTRLNRFGESVALFYTTDIHSFLIQEINVWFVNQDRRSFISLMFSKLPSESIHFFYHDQYLLVNQSSELV